MEYCRLQLDPSRKEPLYRQLYLAIAAQIRSGTLPQGEKLPGKRAMAGQLGVSQNTVETAYEMLLSEGYLRSKPRSGFYVQAMPTRPQVTAQEMCIRDRLMCVLSVSIVGTCYQATGLSGLVKSGGDTGFVFKNDSIFVFLVVLPASVLALVLNAPVWVVFACLKCDQVLKCFVAVVKINRFNWMKKLTREVG